MFILSQILIGVYAKISDLNFAMRWSWYWINPKRAYIKIVTGKVTRKT